MADLIVDMSTRIHKKGEELQKIREDYEELIKEKVTPFLSVRSVLCGQSRIADWAVCV